MTNINKIKKIAICGSHGVGKSKICEKIKSRLYNNYFEVEKLKINKESEYGPTEIYYNFKSQFAYIPEQFREVVKDLNLCNSITLKQTEEITLATYAKQLYLENLYTAQGKNILCDRSVLDTFVYYDYFNGKKYATDGVGFIATKCVAINYTRFHHYNKIYLIEPSDREIEADGFRLTDKKQQLEIHKLFLKHFKDFENVEIINQEEAHKDSFIEKIVSSLDSIDYDDQ
jgi:thymidylate kinase